MRRCLFGSFLAVSLSAFAFCAPPDAEPPAIQFPIIPAEKIEPPRPPQPQSQPTLTTGLTYQIVCRVPCVVRAYPAGQVLIQAIPVPSGETFHAQRDFVDGTKDRTWKGPLTVYFVTNDPKSSKDGLVDLVVTPLGLKAESEIATSSIYVDNQKKPKPPPDPIPPPKPSEKSFRVLFIYESATTVPQAQVSVRDAKSVRTYLDENTTKENGVPGYRAYDKDSSGDKESPEMKALWEAVKPKVTTVPCLAIEKNGRVDIVPYPATPTDAVNLFKKYNGG